MFITIGSHNTQGEPIKETVLLEFQGELKLRLHDESYADKFVGNLFFSEDGKPIAIIGHHLLHGKIEKLEKPLAIMEKNEGQVGHQLVNNPNVNYYNIKSIIKRRVIFNGRPKPIIASVPKKM